jgi:hypothetical protein
LWTVNNTNYTTFIVSISHAISTAFLSAYGISYIATILHSDTSTVKLPQLYPNPPTHFISVERTQCSAYISSVEYTFEYSFTVAFTTTHSFTFSPAIHDSQ